MDNLKPKVNNLWETAKSNRAATNRERVLSSGICSSRLSAFVFVVLGNVVEPPFSFNSLALARSKQRKKEHWEREQMLDGTHFALLVSILGLHDTNHRHIVVWRKHSAETIGRAQSSGYRSVSSFERIRCNRNKWWWSSCRCKRIPRERDRQQMVSSQPATLQMMSFDEAVHPKLDEILHAAGREP